MAARLFAYPTASSASATNPGQAGIALPIVQVIHAEEQAPAAADPRVLVGPGRG
jgi:hypothetical protein